MNLNKISLLCQTAQFTSFYVDPRLDGRYWSGLQFGWLDKGFRSIGQNVRQNFSVPASVDIW